MNRHQWRVLVAAALTIGILCWAGGARVGAGYVKRHLQTLLAGAAAQVLTVDQLRFNPFTLNATFTGLRVDDAETGPVLTAAAGRVRLSINGLFDNAIVVSDLLLEQPRLVVTVSGQPENYQLHSLGGLLPAATDGRQRPPVRIARAHITNGHLTVYDATDSSARTTPMAIHIGDVYLAMTNLISDATTAASFELAARINDSGALGAQGSWVPASHTVDAAVQLSGLVLEPFTNIFKIRFPDTQLAGVLSVDGDIRHVTDKPGFTGALVIEDLHVNDRSGEALLSASRLAAHGLTIGNGRPVAGIQWLELDQPGVTLLFGEDGHVNLRRLIIDPLPQIDKVTVRDGQIGFTDARLPSTVQIDSHNIAGELSKSVNDSRQMLTMSLTGALADKGMATLDGVYLVNDGQIKGEGNATLSGAAARTMSPYVASWIAREIVDGVMDINLHYAIDEQGLAVSNKIMLADLQLNTPSQDAKAVGLPVGLAVALLTDEHGRMVVELPVNVASIDSANAIQKEFGDALKNFINATTTAPLNTLARLAGLAEEEVVNFEFAAGSAEIRPEAEHRLTALVDALKRRPLLGVRVMGHHSVRTDSEALARRQIELHIALAASTSAGHSSLESGLDFADPKVQGVLDEFAAARLNTAERTTLNIAAQNTGDETETGATPSWYPALFEALVAKESVSDYALRQLARYRARSLVGRLQEMGIETQRLAVDRKATPMELEGAPPAVTLTLFAYRPSDE